MIVVTGDNRIQTNDKDIAYTTATILGGEIIFDNNVLNDIDINWYPEFSKGFIKESTIKITINPSQMALEDYFSRLVLSEKMPAAKMCVGKQNCEKAYKYHKEFISEKGRIKFGKAEKGEIKIAMIKDYELPNNCYNNVAKYNIL